MTTSTAPKNEYLPAVTPNLRKLLVLIFVIVALLGANSIYLVTVTVIEAITGQAYQNYFYNYMFLGHLALGLLLIVPFFVFCGFHMRNTWRRKNRRAVTMGFALFCASTILLLTGLLLTRAGPWDLKAEVARNMVYWMHVIFPLVVPWLYWLHRLAGPPIKWRVGVSYLAVVGVICGGIILLHNSDPRSWNQVGSPGGAKYFEPSLARTSTGKFIPDHVLSNEQYCLECHADVHASWASSAHRFSSFNNQAYLVSVRETREFSKRLDGNVQRARWCAGCHDPVPFFSGKFDDPDFDDIRDPTAHAGITCTVCHAITNVNSPRGNADYTIEEPLHYPFAFSENETLKWINRQLVKAKPSFHKKTFLKPHHKTEEFCATCHKVHLPQALNDYRFLRGQNHFDSYLLSGVSGHGARSFYYPEIAQENCNNCHMPTMASNDFGAKVYEPGGERSVHDHLFLGANTALPFWRDDEKTIAAHREFLEGSARVDIFGLREGGSIDGKQLAPLRPDVPQLKPGERYLLDIVIRTLTLGHHFTQGTADSNEIWLEVIVKSGELVVGRSGSMSENGEVDPWSHFVNVFMLDRDGNRIDRRNAQDIFVPLYNHQIPPGAGQTVHFAMDVPEDLSEPLTVEVKLQYRKFDQQYMAIVAEKLTADDDPLPGTVDGQYRNNLPITTIGSDQITFGVTGVTDSPAQESMIPVWQRWNDYGIGLFLKGKAELKQATEAFAEVEKLNRYDGPLNLARVLHREGRLDDAVEAIRRAAEHSQPPAPPWTVAWLSGLVNREQGYLSDAADNFRSVLADTSAEMRRRKFDFSRDYEVINLLGQTLYGQARGLRGAENAPQREALLSAAEAYFQKTLAIDPENVTAHYNLQLLYAQIGDNEKSLHHQQLHQQYKPDDNARDRAVAAARMKYPAANKAAAAVVIYDLQRVERQK